MKNLYLYKNSYYYIIFGLFMLLSTSACKKDFLNLAPRLDLAEEDAFDTPSRIEAQVNGLYSSLKHGRLLGGRYLIYNDIRANDFLNRGNNVVTGFSSYLYTNDPSDTYIADFWLRAYGTINRVNKFIQDFDQAADNIVTDQQKAAYIAEAKFVRAYAYYALVQLFARPYAFDNGLSIGLPLRLQAETSSENNDLAFSTVGQIYDQIILDLHEAEPDLPLQYSTANLNTTRAHRNTAIALKTRIFLAKHDFENVLLEANKIVSAAAPFQAPTGVSNSLVTDFSNIFSAYNTLESVLSFPMSENDLPGTQNQLGYYYNAGNIEYYLDPEGLISDWEHWGITDQRRNLLGTSAIGASTFQILTKWAGSGYTDWVPAIRYAEVLLNAAEAEAELDQLDRAILLVQAVRSRSDASYIIPNLSTKEDVLTAIYLERRIEFLGEGFRVPDLQRRLAPIPSIGVGEDITVTDNRYIFPIPTVEVLTNLAQNN